MTPPDNDSPMNTSQAVKGSKRLSYVLRHKPDAVGIALDASGWVPVDRLLAALQEHGDTVSRADLQHVVETNSKKRFEFDPSGTSIRASQGHSVDVELGYEPSAPPDVLFHATPEQSLASILATGLDKRARHHVHMSTNRETTIEAARRRGKPVLLAIDSAKMHADGCRFYKSPNAVWLTEHVPPPYLTVVTRP